MILFFNYLSFLFSMFICFLLYFISVKYINIIDHTIIKYLFFPIIFLLLNYSFIKFTLRLIRYYNDLILLKQDQIIIIKTSLIDTDNIEIIDIDKITKIDSSMTWIIQNFFAFWDLILEQNRDRTRNFNYIYKPYNAVNSIKEMKKNEEK